MIYKNNFPNALREIRKRYNLTQDELSEKLDVTRSAVSLWESGKRVPGPNMVEKISTTFRVDYNFLFGDDRLQVAKRIRIPILGKVPCGEPIEAIEEVIGYEDIDADFGAVNDMFALIANGNSMDPLIMDGDTLIVKYQAVPETGKIFIVKVNGHEATCKKISISSDGITLIPTNSSFEPVYYDKKAIESEPLTIIGKVVEVRRKL